MHEFLPLGGRLEAIKLVFAVIVAAAVAATLADVYELVLAHRHLSGEDIGASWADLRAVQAAILLAQFGLYLAGATVFTRWLYRAYRNLDAVRPGLRRFRRGWAVAAWFVPVLNLWRPKEIVNDVWRAGGTEPPELVTAWWLLFLATGWLGAFAMSWIVPVLVDPGLRLWALLSAMANLADALAAAVTVVVAIALTRQVNTGWETRTTLPEPSAAARQLQAARG